MEDGRPRPSRPSLEHGLEEKNMKRPSMQVALGIVLCAGIGAAWGVVAGHAAAWLGVGIAIGVVIGSNFRGTNCAECAEVHGEHQAKSQQPAARG